MMNQKGELITSTFFIFTDIGLGLGPFIQGFFAPSLGYSELYFVLGIIAVICLPLHYFLFGKKATQQKSSCSIKCSSHKVFILPLHGKS